MNQSSSKSAKDTVQLSSRAETILKTLIGRYINDGQPVGSKVLVNHSGLELSSATIRNVMVELESLGLVNSPHTSAGRIPTAKGYRMFVDSMLKIQPLRQEVIQEMQLNIGSDTNAQQLIKNASKLMSQITHYAGVVMLPRQQESRLRQVEFVALSKTRILAILVTQDGQVQNRVIQLEKEFNPSELVQAANYFNESYAGQTLEQVQALLFNELKAQGEQLSDVLKSTLNIAEKMFKPSGNDHEDVVVSGETNFVDVPEFSEVSKLKDLFEAFKTKHDLLELLDKSMSSKGVQIFIGEESGYQMLNGCSIVTAPYQVDGECLGVLGVVGPTRMQYCDVIPVVDLTAKLLGQALSGDYRGDFNA